METHNDKEPETDDAESHPNYYHLEDFISKFTGLVMIVPYCPGENRSITFVFDYIDCKDHWEIDIKRWPYIPPKYNSAYILGTVLSQRGFRRISFQNGCTPKNEADAKIKSTEWAEQVTHYIKTGIRPEDQKHNKPEMACFGVFVI